MSSSPSNTAPSTDYHDYVFQNGRLIGAFEEMYRHSKDVPWHQDKDAERLDCSLAVEILRLNAIPGKLLEVGCGLGYFGKLIHSALKPSGYTGTDISPTAVVKAKALFPDLDFAVMDLTKPLDGQGWEGRTYEMVVIRATFWYLIRHLDQAVKNLTDLTAPGGVLFISQNFPPLDSNFVGKDVLPNPASLLALFTPRFQVRMTNYFEDRRDGKPNDNWMMFAAVK
ncbi:MAG TPA: class I SAM-dependent methyltransferase [Verrucomicrobiae bacterium]|nr:class I SAM-dependent methyltransferase [Verrucomicrobiae bacterium]